MTTSITPGPADPGAWRPPALWSRRIPARLIDTLLAVVLSAVICWPLAWTEISELLGQAGVSSIPALLGLSDIGAAVQSVLVELLPVVVLTLTAQAVIAWLYEALATVLTTTTVGKALMRLRVTQDHPEHLSATGAYPVRVGRTARGSRRRGVPSSAADPWRGHSSRTMRLVIRAALVVAPAAAAVIALVAAGLGAEGAADAATVAVAITIGLVIAAFATRNGLHSELTGTQVVGFEWERVQAQARARAQRAEGRLQTEALGMARRASGRMQTDSRGWLRDLGAEVDEATRRVQGGSSTVRREAQTAAQRVQATGAAARPGAQAVVRTAQTGGIAARTEAQAAARRLQAGSTGVRAEVQAGTDRLQAAGSGGRAEADALARQLLGPSGYAEAAAALDRLSRRPGAKPWVQRLQRILGEPPPR